MVGIHDRAIVIAAYLFNLMFGFCVDRKGNPLNTSHGWVFWQKLQGKWLFLITVIIVLMIGYSFIKSKKQNYTLLWQRVNALWSVYCEDTPADVCRPSLNFPCEVCNGF